MKDFTAPAVENREVPVGGVQAPQHEELISRVAVGGDDVRQGSGQQGATARVVVGQLQAGLPGITVGADDDEAVAPEQRDPQRGARAAVLPLVAGIRSLGPGTEQHRLIGAQWAIGHEHKHVVRRTQGWADDSQEHVGARASREAPTGTRRGPGHYFQRQ